MVGRHLDHAAELGQALHQATHVGLGHAVLVGEVAHPRRLEAVALQDGGDLPSTAPRRARRASANGRAGAARRRRRRRSWPGLPGRAAPGTRRPASASSGRGAAVRPVRPAASAVGLVETLSVPTSLRAPPALRRGNRALSFTPASASRPSTSTLAKVRARPSAASSTTALRRGPAARPSPRRHRRASKAPARPAGAGCGGCAAARRIDHRRAAIVRCRGSRSIDRSPGRARPLFSSRTIWARPRRRRQLARPRAGPCGPSRAPHPR